MEAETKVVGGRVLYRCPVNIPPCDRAGWMTGGAMWQHLRGFAHVMNHEAASDAIANARAKALGEEAPDER